ncbi:hypothetical protein VDGL01_10105 [Verticillium dahliae]
MTPSNPKILAPSPVLKPASAIQNGQREITTRASWRSENRSRAGPGIFFHTRLIFAFFMPLLVGPVEPPWSHVRFDPSCLQTLLMFSLAPAVSPLAAVPPNAAATRGPRHLHTTQHRTGSSRSLLDALWKLGA